MKGWILVSAGMPLVIAAVAVDADTSEGKGVEPCKVGHDESQMACGADHRMRFIRVALPGPISGVGMHVGDYAKLVRLAKLPKASVAGALKHDDAGIQRVTIEIIVTDIRGDAYTIGRGEKERAALPLACAPGPEVTNERKPTPIGDGNIFIHQMLD